MTWQDVGFWAVIIGGLGLFLFGITYLSDTLKKVAGSKLRNIIAKAASNRVKGSLIGMFFTTIIQSSSGTTALSIGLVRAGVMTFPAAIAVIIGANVGTTVTAFLISIPFGEYMPFVLFIGAFIMMITSKRSWQNASKLLFSFGAIFFGLLLMETNLKTLAGEQWFVDFLAGLTNAPWLGLLVGILVTMALQSSSAVIGVLQGIYAASIIAAKASGAPLEITLFGILPILFGANIGTCITALLSCIGGSTAAKRTALFHVLFNVSGALLFMGVIYIFQGFLTDTNSWLMGIDPKLQIALCHIVFNVVMAIIFLPLLTPIVKLCEFVIRDKSSVGEDIVHKELDKSVIKKFPETGISLAKDLSLDMFEYTKKMFTNIGEYLKKSDKEREEYIHLLEDAVDHIDRQLNEFLLSAETGSLTPTALKTYSTILKGTKDIERIGDYGETLIGFYSHANEIKETYTPEQIQSINFANTKAIELISKTLEIYKTGDTNKALEVVKIRRDYIKQIEKYQEEHFERTLDTNAKSSYINLVYVDILNSYERILAHCSNIAKLFNSDKSSKDYPKSDDELFKKMSERY